MTRALIGLAPAVRRKLLAGLGFPTLLDDAPPRLVELEDQIRPRSCAHSVRQTEQRSRHQLSLLAAVSACFLASTALAQTVEIPEADCGSVGETSSAGHNLYGELPPNARQLSHGPTCSGTDPNGQPIGLAAVVAGPDGAPTGAMVISLEEDPSERIDLTTGEQQLVPGGTEHCGFEAVEGVWPAIAVSPDGQFVAVACGNVAVFKVPS